jgi:hypothetical protein
VTALAITIPRDVAGDPHAGTAGPVPHLKSPRTEHLATNGYVVVNAYLECSAAARVVEADLSQGSFHLRMDVPTGTFIIGEKRAAYSGVITAATMSPSPNVAGKRAGTHAYVRLPMCSSEYWRTLNPSTDPVYVFEDRRLQPFFERLKEIETGPWEEYRGKRPNQKALEGTRSILQALQGSELVPERLIASDRRIVLYFAAGEKYSTVECMNTGKMIVVKSDGHSVPEVDVFSAPKLRAVLDDIRAYLG